MDFGERLRLARKAKNLSQEQLGKGLGVSEPDVSKQTVYGWEKNKHFPTARQLALICERLGESADWLLLGKKPDDIKSLNGLEAQLVMMFRALPESEQDEILQDANHRYNKATTVASSGNPYSGVKVPTRQFTYKKYVDGATVTAEGGYTGPERRKSLAPHLIGNVGPIPQENKRVGNKNK